jgi:IclR family KDG regulon transcriptional repressor
MWSLLPPYSQFQAAYSRWTAAVNAYGSRSLLLRRCWRPWHASTRHPDRMAMSTRIAKTAGGKRVHAATARPPRSTRRDAIAERAPLLRASRPAAEVTSAARKPEVPGTAAFSKFMTVLQHVADNPGTSNAAQVHKAVGLPRATAHRILAALVAEGMLVEGLQHGALELGPRLINLASQAWDRLDLRQVARNEIVKLRDTTGETVHLAVPSGREMVYIDKLESLRAVRMTSRIGARIPLHSTSVGKAYLGALDLATRRELLDDIELLPHTPNTLTTRRLLEADVVATARRGYSIDREETEPDIICYGCAIQVHGGPPMGCVSVTIPKYRLSAAASKACREGVMACAQAISARMAATRGRDSV